MKLGTQHGTNITAQLHEGLSAINVPNGKLVSGDQQLLINYMYSLISIFNSLEQGMSGMGQVQRNS